MPVKPLERIVVYFQWRLLPPGICTRGWRKRDDQKVCRKAECRDDSASRAEMPSPPIDICPLCVAGTTSSISHAGSSVQRRARFDARRRLNLKIVPCSNLIEEIRSCLEGVQHGAGLFAW
jgi:hypothetical protein